MTRQDRLDHASLTPVQLAQEGVTEASWRFPYSASQTNACIENGGMSTR